MNEERSRRLRALLKAAYRLTGIGEGQYKALVIDDSFTQRQALIRKLGPQPLQLIDTDNGHDGLQLFMEQKFDIVFLDVTMPGMDGFAVCQALRRLPGGNDIPIIMITTQSTEENILRAKAVKADDFLTKPITRVTLASKIAKNLARYKKVWPPG